MFELIHNGHKWTLGEGNMFTLERQNAIHNILKEKKTVTVHELSARFFTSEASIRRDLAQLEKSGTIKRTYGGAVLLEGSNVEIYANVREQEQNDPKTEIAQIAAELIQNQDIIFLDASTTTKQITKFLSEKNNLTVITNGIHTMLELSELNNVSVYGIGGKLRNHSLSIIGAQAEQFVSNFWATKFFFSCTGLSETLGAMDYSDAEAEVRKKIMHNCQMKILLADHTKFNRPAFYRTCSFDELDMLITDQRPSNEWMEVLTRSGVEVHFPVD